MPNTLDYETPLPLKARSFLREAIVFAAGAGCGALIWALSPALTGNVEAWDATLYYCAGLYISGFVAACFAPSRFWIAPIGVYCGQVAYVACGQITGSLPAGPLWILGACMGLGYCALALAGAVVPGGIAQLARRRARP